MTLAIPTAGAYEQPFADIVGPQAKDYRITQSLSGQTLNRTSRSLGTHEFHRVVAMVTVDDHPAVEVPSESFLNRRELQMYALRPAEIRQREALMNFIGTVTSDGSNGITGVFVPDTLSMSVQQQPEGKPGYVSPVDNIITQFSLASQRGTIGLLAHNDLAGARFFDLSIGQEVTIVYGDGSVKNFTISEIRRVQAKQPYSPFSDFLDLDHADAKLSIEALFYQIYQGENRVVFQT